MKNQDQVPGNISAPQFTQQDSIEFDALTRLGNSAQEVQALTYLMALFISAQTEGPNAGETFAEDYAGRINAGINQLSQGVNARLQSAQKALLAAYSARVNLTAPVIAKAS